MLWFHRLSRGWKTLACELSAFAVAASCTAETQHPEPHAAHQTGYQHSFADVEKYAKRFDDPKRDAWQQPQRVVDALGLQAGSTVVDLGAGTGYFAPYLSRAVGPAGKVLALDVEPRMVDYLSARSEQSGWTNVEARVVAPDDPGLPPRSADCVLIVNTWHHLGDRPRYAEKLARSLTVDGRIWVVDYTPESDQGPPPEHRLPASRVVAELVAAGLTASVVAGLELPKQYVISALSPPRGATSED